MSAREEELDSVADQLYEVGAADPTSRLIDRSGVAPSDIEQIGRLMGALANLRTAEQRLSEASQKYMKLSPQDMRAIHYLIIASHRNVMVTPGALASHLGISAASTSKLLNRLEKGNHITRDVHPEDRRAFSVRVTPDTAESAMDTVGRQHAQRFHSAARLTTAERDVVIEFLKDMTDQLSVAEASWAADDAT